MPKNGLALIVCSVFCPYLYTRRTQGSKFLPMIWSFGVFHVSVSCCESDTPSYCRITETSAEIQQSLETRVEDFHLSVLYEALQLPWQPRPFLVLKGFTMVTEALLYCGQVWEDTAGFLTCTLAQVSKYRTRRRMGAHPPTHMCSNRG